MVQEKEQLTFGNVNSYMGYSLLVNVFKALSKISFREVFSALLSSGNIELSC